MKKSKHPSGLPFLFFSEMWERFGYYLMIGIFTLYLEAPASEGGFGMDRNQSADVYGTFIALVFLTPFLGGLLADRIMGYRLSITLGGLLMGTGYSLLYFQGPVIFYLALFLIILGNGFFKPNISTLLGNLYNDEPYRPLKDAGYNIFYSGINVGAFICNFFGAAMLNAFGWGAAFLMAGVGMFIGVIVFWIGMKHYRHADVLKPVREGDAKLSSILTLTLLPAAGTGILGWLIPGNIFGSDSTDAFLFGAIPVCIFYYLLYHRASSDEKKPIGAMLAVFAVVVIFWAVFKQNGTALTTWANYYTAREIPAAVVPAAEAISNAKTEKAKLEMRDKLDHHFRKLKDDSGKVIKDSIYPAYFQNIGREVKPGEEVKLAAPNVYQSINPGWVIVLTPLVVLFFGFLKSRGKEPTTPSKIAWGLVISALSTLVMVGAVYAGGNGEVKVSTWWLIASYGVITVGELCLSPMGLSLVSKMSPPRITSLMMGGWFLATSLGNKFSGILATMWDGYENKTYFFLVNFALLGAAAIMIFLMLRWLNKVFKQYGG